MNDTLAALHAAVLKAPAERTVRLVYADALDESGDPAHAARAEFIRAQIELEAMADGDARRGAFAERCEELFAEHWIEWWRPVCAAVGLPEPRPRRRRRAATGSRRRSTAGNPYKLSPTPGSFSIESAEPGFTAQFIGGFPEMLYFSGAPRLLNRWPSALPLARLRWAGGSDAASWEALNVPELAKLSELVIDQLPPEGATLLARSEHLRGLASLKVLPLRPAALVVRSLLSNPTWSGLRSLTLTGVTPPDALHALSECCRLESLDSLAFGMSEVPAPPTLGLTGAIGTMISEMLAQIFASFPVPQGPISWPDYWPAFAALARSPVLPRLRSLRVLDVSHVDAIGWMFRQVGPSSGSGPGDFFPDALVSSVADRLNPDRLERLELPAARLTPASRAGLADRFGPRAVLA